MLYPYPYPSSARRPSGSLPGESDAAETGNLPQLDALRNAVRELADRPEIDEEAHHLPSLSHSSTSASIEDNVAAVLTDEDRHNERSARRRSSRRFRRLPQAQPFVPSWGIEVVLSLLDGTGDVRRSGQEHILAGVLAFIIMMLILSCFSAERVMLAFVFLLCFGASGVGIILSVWLLSLQKGTDNMQAVAGLLQECAAAYISVMFGRLYKFMVPIMGLIFILYLIHGSVLKSLATSIAFALGACCSSSVNIASLWICARSSVRVAHIACTSTMHDAIVAASRSGIIIGVIVNVVVLMSIMMLFVLFNLCVEPDVAEIPKLLLGFCLGTSYVATFAQIGGDIFAKAAAISVEHFKPLEHVVPQDAHNPAVVVNVVGQIVGHSCARSADFFQSLSVAIVGSMLLGGCLAQELKFNKLDATNFIVFPIVMSALNLVVNICAAMLLQVLPMVRVTLSLPGVFTRGYVFAVVCSAFFFGLTSWAMLYVRAIPLMWWNFTGCGVCGLLAGFMVMIILQQDATSDVQPSALDESSDTRVAIMGSSSLFGIQSVLVPVAVIGGVILVSCQYGRKAHLHDKIDKDFHGIDNIGLYGIAVATLGLLSTLTYCLIMDVVISVTNAASSITELSPDCPEGGITILRSIRQFEKPLRSFTKGFAVTSASLVCFVLFRALVHTISRQTPDQFKHTHISVDISQPEIFVGGTLGVLMIYIFGSWIVEAIGTTAQHFVIEVRRHFTDHAANFECPERRVDIGHFATIVTRVALNEMFIVGIIAIALPILIASFFKASTYLNGHPHLGAQTTIAYVICSIMAACIQSCITDDCDKRPASPGPQRSSDDRSALDRVSSLSIAKGAVGSALHVLVKLAATVAIIFVPLTMPPTAGTVAKS